MHTNNQDHKEEEEDKTDTAEAGRDYKLRRGAFFHIYFPFFLYLCTSTASLSLPPPQPGLMEKYIYTLRK